MKSDKSTSVSKHGVFDQGKPVSKAERRRREEAVTKLREEGFSYLEIAEQTNLTRPIVKNVVNKLISEARLISLRTTTSEKLERFSKEVTKLRKKGRTRSQISKRLKLSRNAVDVIISQLIAKGEIERRANKMIQLSKAERRRREEAIIEMVKNRASMGEIASQFGFSKQRASQVIMRIREKHGDAVLAADETLKTLAEAADELGVSRPDLAYLFRKGDVSGKRRGSGKNSHRLVDEDVMTELRKHPLVTRKKNCARCGKIFVIEHGHGQRTICSREDCRNRYHQQRRAELINSEVAGDSLCGWRKEFWVRLQKHEIPEDEEWIGLRESMSTTGLSKMQIIWLRLRGIVTISPHPTRKWKGQPVALYAASEMMIAKEVKEAYDRQCAGRN